MEQAINQLTRNFKLLPSWEEKYAYIIECGKSLKPLDIRYKTDANKVSGCVSQVWLIGMIDAESKLIFFEADSDSYLVKGLIYVLVQIYSARPYEEIISSDAGEIFENLGLKSHLTPSRSNGFFAIAQRIKQIASQFGVNQAIRPPPST